MSEAEATHVPAQSPLQAEEAQRLAEAERDQEIRRRQAAEALVAELGQEKK